MLGPASLFFFVGLLDKEATTIAGGEDRQYEAGIRELGDQLLELISSDEKLVEGIKQMAKDTGVDNLAESFGALKEEAGRGDTSRLVVTVKKFLDPKGRRTRLLLLAGFLVAGFLVAWIPSTIESLELTWLNEWTATASAAVLWAVDQFRRGNGSVMRAPHIPTAYPPSRGPNCGGPQHSILLSVAMGSIPPKLITSHRRRTLHSQRTKASAV